MKTRFLLPLLAGLGLAAAAPAQADDTDPIVRPAPSAPSRGLGSVVAGPYDVETPTFDNRCLGVEYAWGHYWVTGAGHTTTGYNYMIHKFDTNGNYLASYPQPNTSAGPWGGRDMEADEPANTLWVGEDNGIVDVMNYDPVTGGLIYNSTVYTAVIGTVRALCRNPNTGTFFTKDFSGDLQEFDMNTGLVVNSWALPTLSAYGFGWDYTTNMIWAVGGASTRLVEVDPVAGTTTGTEVGTVLGGAPGGGDVYDDPRNPNLVSIVALHQTAPDSIVVYDTVGPPPGLNWTVNLPSGRVAAAGLFDDFEAYGGVVPPHMALTAIEPVSGLPDPEAWCNIGGASGLGASSGTACLEMGLDPTSINYHTVRNALVVGLDGGGFSSHTLDFMAIDYGEELNSFDGVWVSADGVEWFQVYTDWGALAQFWQAVTGIDLSSTGAVTTGSFYLMFGQEDNYPYGYLDGVGVDDLSITSAGPTGPFLSVSNLVAGGVATIQVVNATPGGVVRHGYSLTGGGPVSTPYGDLLLSPPFTELPPMTANASGVASMSAPVPPQASGVAVWLHAFDLGSLTFTNGLAEVIG
ncbi:MAG: hypothetical protein D6702_08370 [Planctomycetota bacterium]|nr:MAG: hypothetical protein D6702_08370 [Planctomycetota bacterium]